MLGSKYVFAGLYVLPQSQIDLVSFDAVVGLTDREYDRSVITIHHATDFSVEHAEIRVQDVHKQLPELRQLGVLSASNYLRHLDI